MKKPNLFVVGAPKSGVTSLYYYLKQHPQIFAPHEITPNYFCFDLRNAETSNSKQKPWHIRWFYQDKIATLKKYNSLYEGWTSEKYGGDFSSGRYLYSKVAAQEIYAFNPEARIIIMLRDPIEFLRSLHSHFVSHLSETIEDFEQALTAEPLRKEGQNIGKSVRCPPLLYYSEMAKFSEQIQRYLQYFPPEQIKIMILDDFKDNPTKAYKELLEFLEVNQNFFPDLSKKYNVNKTVRWKFLRKLTKFPYLWKAVKVILPLGMYQRIRKIFLKEQIRIPLDPQFKEKLMSNHKPEVEKLAKLLNRDLITLWGYDKLN